MNHLTVFCRFISLTLISNDICRIVPVTCCSINMGQKSRHQRTNSSTNHVYGKFTQKGYQKPHTDVALLYVQLTHLTRGVILWLDKIDLPPRYPIILTQLICTTKTAALCPPIISSIGVNSDNFLSNLLLYYPFSQRFLVRWITIQIPLNKGTFCTASLPLSCWFLSLAKNIPLI